MNEHYRQPHYDYEANTGLRTVQSRRERLSEYFRKAYRRTVRINDTARTIQRSIRTSRWDISLTPHIEAGTSFREVSHSWFQLPATGLPVHTFNHGEASRGAPYVPVSSQQEEHLLAAAIDTAVHAEQYNEQDLHNAQAFLLGFMSRTAFPDDDVYWEVQAELKLQRLVSPRDKSQTVHHYGGLMALNERLLATARGNLERRQATIAAARVARIAAARARQTEDDTGTVCAVR